MKRKNPKFEIGKVFGKKLAEFRKAKGLTQKELAKKIGTSQRMIAYYEGNSCYVPLNLLPAITKALKVSTDELFGIKKSIKSK
jgi:transcriptional regulator with XRE-family HTH domain